MKFEFVLGLNCIEVFMRDIYALFFLFALHFALLVPSSVQLFLMRQGRLEAIWSTLLIALEKRRSVMQSMPKAKA